MSRIPLSVTLAAVIATTVCLSSGLATAEPQEVKETYQIVPLGVQLSSTLETATEFADRVNLRVDKDYSFEVEPNINWTTVPAVRPATAGLAVPAQVINAPADDDAFSGLNSAWKQASPYTALAAGLGGTAGAMIGMIIGCPLGAITLGSLVAVASIGVLTVPAMIGGCLAGAATTSAFLGLAGSVAAGGGVGLGIAIDKYSRTQSAQ